MEFHEKLQELRIQKELTQEKLAEALFVSRTAISKWESGRGYPNIESLKAISRFFSVTVDELLSGKEILTIAEEENRKSKKNFCDIVFGLLDFCTILFLFLPLFGERVGGIVRGVSLLSMSATQGYLKTAYFAVVAGTVGYGIVTLLLQNCEHVLWIKNKGWGSLLLNAGGVLLFMISRQTYASVFVFVFLIIKTQMLLKYR